MSVADQEAPTPIHWLVLVPLKDLDRAKSRLSRRPAGERQQLSLAFALDTVRVATACPQVHSVLVVGDEASRERVMALGADWCAEGPEPGLNPALRHAAAVGVARHAGVGLAALAGDLPALRSEELTAALRAFRAPRSFVSDAAGVGTTLLLAGPGVELDPRFGVRSRADHAASGAHELDLTGIPGLRRDVDTEVDLWDAVRLGTGPSTRSALAGPAPATAP
jgi:2-phospho-L-lactate guanylyltransferase